MGKPITIAFWSGVIAIGLTVILSILGQLFLSLGLSPKVLVLVSIIIGGISGIFWILFVYGFYVIGKKYESKFLRVISAVSIVIFVLGVIIMIPFQNNLISLSEKYAGLTEQDFENLDREQLKADMFEFLKFFLVLYLWMSIVISILTILGGVALLKVSKKVKHARTAGILKIVAGATYIIFIGFFIRMVAYVFELMMIYSESKKESARVSPEKKRK